MRRFAKRAGVVATLFFLIKGLAWLVLLAGAAGWVGGAGAADPQKEPTRDVSATSTPHRDDGWAQAVPMGMGRAVHRFTALGAAAANGESQTTIAATCVAVTALTASLVAMRLNHRRAGRADGAGSIDSISRSTAGRTARAASLRPCV